MNTIDYYNENAKNYFDKTVNTDMQKQYNIFLKYVKENGRILDFGCGSGRDSKYFRTLGYKVDAIDGSLELCKLAREYTGIDVKCMDFKDFNEKSIYDGVWACSTLLHIKRSELLDLLKRIRLSLKDDGCLYASFLNNDNKEEYKKDGRYFNDLTNERFEALANDSEFRVIDHFTNYSNVKSHQEKYGSTGISWSSYILKRR
jgi:SAM-dependent methyltransferase